MEEGCLAVIFLVLGVIAIAVAVVIAGVPMYLDSKIATRAGVVIEVDQHEYTGNGVTTGGNTTVVILDRLWLALAWLAMRSNVTP
jgi:hypothetical protein